MKIDRVVVWVLAAAARLVAQTYFFEPTGSNQTVPQSINASGAITGQYVDASRVYHGFVRDPQGNITSFDPTGSTATYAYGINKSGAITGQYADFAFHGFVRDPQGNITSFDAPGSIMTFAAGINTSGAVTGGYQDVTGFHGFVRDPHGIFTSFDAPGGTSTSPASINPAGAVTGKYYDANKVAHGFVRDFQGNITSFDPPGSTSTSPASVNLSGVIAGYYYDANNVAHGFVRDPHGNVTSFDPAGSINTLVYSMNSSGAITGNYLDATLVYHGFVRDPQGNITSFDAGFVPQSINASGAITGAVGGGGFAGAGTAPNGIDVSKYTTPPYPSWSSAVLAGVSNVMVQAWGGVSKNKFANAQLNGAQSSGLHTGAYLLLTYFSNLSAEQQVAVAAQAIGSAITNLKLMAVEVKTCCGEFVSWKASTNYVAGAQIMDPANHIQKVTGAGTSGAQAPMWNDTGGTTTDGTVTWQDTGNVVISRAQRIAYISNAVAYINKQYPTLKVAIHTSNGNWQTVTGNCGTSGTNACPALIALPLWDVEHKEFTGGDGNKHLGDGVAGLVPWKPWGTATWQTRDGNQYDWGLCTTAVLPLEENPDPEARPAAATCGYEFFFGVTAVDLDYFNPTLFQ